MPDKCNIVLMIFIFLFMNLFFKVRFLLVNIFPISMQTQVLYPYWLILYFWTNIGPIPVERIFKHIIRPQNSKARLLEFMTDNCILTSAHQISRPMVYLLKMFIKGYSNTKELLVFVNITSFCKKVLFLTSILTLQHVYKYEYKKLYTSV